jgi:hypothetical protein
MTQADRFRSCAHCGTEVDADAAFCPSCGRPLADADRELQAPPPTWPAASGSAGGGGAATDEGAMSTATGETVPEEEPTAALRIPPELPRQTDWRRSAAVAEVVRPAEAAPQAESPGAGLPLTWPRTVSGWLIGVGALVAAVAMFLPWLDADRYTLAWGLASAVNILFFLILLGVAATIFLSSSVPHLSVERLTILAIALIGLGIGLDRVSLPTSVYGALIFFVAMLGVAIGALLVELNADRPLRGPSR